MEGDKKPVSPQGATLCFRGPGHAPAMLGLPDRAGGGETRGGGEGVPQGGESWARAPAGITEGQLGHLSGPNGWALPVTAAKPLGRWRRVGMAASCVWTGRSHQRQGSQGQVLWKMGVDVGENYLPAHSSRSRRFRGSRGEEPVRKLGAQTCSRGNPRRLLAAPGLCHFPLPGDGASGLALPAFPPSPADLPRAP